MGVASVIVVHAYGADATVMLPVDVVVPLTAAEGRYCPLVCVVQSATRSEPV